MKNTQYLYLVYIKHIKNTHNPTIRHLAQFKAKYAKHLNRQLYTKIMEIM